MKTVTFQENWPESWRYSHPYDLAEVYGDTTVRGYSYAYASRRRQTIELVQKVATGPAKILDIAAAQGNFSLLLAELGYEVTWNDLREDLMEYVKLKHDHGIINFAPGNVFDQEFLVPFDVVLMTEIIEHVAHPDQFLQQAARFVKPGGHIIMTTPNGEYWRNHLPKFSECSDPSQFEAVQYKPNADGHIFLLHQDEIAPLAAKAGLSVVEVRLFTNTLTNGHLKSEVLLKLLPRSVVDRIEAMTSRLPHTARRRLNTGMAVLFKRTN